jgi:hypothetical protein
MTDRFSRRAFFYFLIAAFVALILFRFRRIQPAPVILEFFDLPLSMQGRVDAALRDLRSHNASIYPETIFFFSLFSAGLPALCPRLVREEVITRWATVLLEDRTVGWPYLGYPQVDNTSICSGLIRMSV